MGFLHINELLANRNCGVNEREKREVDRSDSRAGPESADRKNRERPATARGAVSRSLSCARSTFHVASTWTGTRGCEKRCIEVRRGSS